MKYISSILIHAAAVYLVFEDYPPFSEPDFLFELLVSGTLAALLVTLLVVVTLYAGARGASDVQ